ncbi:MAG: hypothetical protein ACTHM1_06980 [Solirubrobacteraceae bacterium]
MCGPAAASEGVVVGLTAWRAGGEAAVDLDRTTGVSRAAVVGSTAEVDRPAGVAVLLVTVPTVRMAVGIASAVPAARVTAAVVDVACEVAVWTAVVVRVAASLTLVLARSTALVAVSVAAPVEVAAAVADPAAVLAGFVAASVVVPADSAALAWITPACAGLARASAHAPDRPTAKARRVKCARGVKGSSTIASFGDSRQLSKHALSCAIACKNTDFY